LPKFIRYNGSNYKAASGNNFFTTIFDTGNYGEYLTFTHLEKLNVYHRLMTNLYIPKKDGSTTEIDLIMLSQSGIYVIESKNYSGWIFGDEKSKNWMQTLQNGQMNRFFNPIWQNKGHINALKNVVELVDEQFYKSYIIFSERCKLKKLSVTSPTVKVIKRNKLIKTIKKDIESSTDVMTKDEVEQLYIKLQKYSLADKAAKESHVENIKKKMS
jgi:hypothetical protein